MNDDDCLIPPKIPADVVGKYGVVRDHFAEESIASYVRGQAYGEEVLHVELIKTEYVLGEKFEIWDVTTDKSSWWVLTNLTNLYPKDIFTSLDYLLSFHIGLMRRLLDNQHERKGEAPSPFDVVERRRTQASNLLDRAIEAEEFQAVGVHLREAMLELIEVCRNRLIASVELPDIKSADFLGWSNYLMDHLAPGPSNKALRKLVKKFADETWQLTNWLVHSKSANQASSSIALHSFDTVCGHFIQMLTRSRTDYLESCPRCASRDVRSFFEATIGEDGDYFLSCAKCDWTSLPGLN